MEREALIELAAKLSGPMPDLEAHKRYLRTLSRGALEDRVTVLRKEEHFHSRLQVGNGQRLITLYENV